MFSVAVLFELNKRICDLNAFMLDKVGINIIYGEKCRFGIPRFRKK